jgi:hypothetical protein
MADEWDQFPDAQQASGQADPFADFPDAQPAQPPGERFATNVRKIHHALPQKPQTWGGALKNVAEGAAEFGTGITGGIAGDVAGLATLAADVATFGQFDLDPAGVRDSVRNATTYRASDQNSLTSNVLQAPGKMMGGAGDYMASFTEIPYAQHVLRAVPMATASYLGVKAGMPVRSKDGVLLPSRIDTRPPQATPEQVAIKEATDIGLKLPPSAVGNKVGNVAEGASGRAPLARELSVQNAKAVDAAAGKAVGIEGKPVTKATIGMEKAKANKAYEAVAKTGTRKTSDAYRQEIAQIDDRTGAGSFADDTPAAVTNLKQIYGKTQQFDASHAVAKIRQLRADARANFKTRDPEKAAVGHAQQKIADALDNELARYVEELGVPELAANYKAARVQLAKLNTVEQAISGANVSAKKIWQQWKRGAPLQGELLAIAKAFDNFPNVLQDAGKVAGNHPFSVVDGLVAAGGAATNPALVGAVFARPLARKALASNAYQRRFVAPRGRAASPPQKAVAPKPAAAAAPLIPADQRRAR